MKSRRSFSWRAPAGRAPRGTALAAAAGLVLAAAGCGDEQSTSSAAPAAPAASGAAAPQAAAPGPTPPAPATVVRWYAPEHVRRGATVYAQHCAACHGDAAQGTSDWRQRDASGRFPPPPLDGSAHAWHHPVQALAYQIKFGAPGGKGAMPPFADKLTDGQVLEVIAWFQDRWPDEIYAAWHDIEVRSRAK